MAAKIQTGLRLEEELYEKLKTLEYIIRRFVAEYESQNGSLPRCQD